MENRKELSEKSKKLIAKQFKSDILNKSTGYYKKENLFPITAKPNELKIKLDNRRQVGVETVGIGVVFLPIRQLGNLGIPALAHDVHVRILIGHGLAPL